MSTCSWMTRSLPSLQCRWPGAFSGGLHGDGRWRCYMHFKLSNEGHGDSALADDVVNASLDWDGATLGYIQFRKHFDDTPRAKPVVKHKAEPIGHIQAAWNLLQKKRAAHAA